MTTAHTQHKSVHECYVGKDMVIGHQQQADERLLAMISTDTIRATGYV